MALLRVPGASWWSTPSPRIAARWQKGLKVAWTGAGKTQLLVPPVRAEGTDLKAFVQTEYGPALCTNDSATGAGLLLPGGPRLPSTDNITIFALTQEFGSIARPSSAFTQRGSATISLALNRLRSGNSSESAVSLWYRSTAVFNRGLTLEGVLPVLGGARAWTSVAVCHLTSNTYRHSVNGAAWGGTTVSSAPSGTNITADQVCMVGGLPGVIEGVSEPLALVFAWERALSQAELDEITRDPSVLFEEDVLWVPASAGGGPPTLAAITASNITTTGVRLTVTV